MDGLQTWVINLDRAPERLARISEQLQRLALPFQRWPAVDAQRLTAAQKAALDEPGYHRKHGKLPVLGELGCYLSHVEVMTAFLASPARYALLLEDDVLLHDSLPGVLQGLLQHPAHWDVVKLSAVHSGTPVPVLQLDTGAWPCAGGDAEHLHRQQRLSRQPQAALAYTQGLLPMSQPYDHAFDQAWQFGLQLRLVTPTPCGHDDRIASTIGGPDPARKFHWTRRWPTYAFRLQKESRRVLYGLQQLARERLLRN